MFSDPTFTLILVVIAVAIIGVAAWWSRSLFPQRLPYFPKEYLLSKGEQAFYRVLMHAVPGGMGISMKARLSDVIGCTAAGWRAGFGAKISQKHVDFVIVDPVTTAILLVIELDDRTHELADRRARDVFVDDALAAAGVPILRVPAARDYNLEDLREKVEHILRNVSVA
ncbi:MAG TPA: DUF2726 domain-containing protein [Humisphaera sp.]